MTTTVGAHKSRTEARALLRRMIADGMVIHDDDLDHAEYTGKGETWIIGLMVDAGYSKGMDEDFRNVWYPKED